MLGCWIIYLLSLTFAKTINWLSLLRVNKYKIDKRIFWVALKKIKAAAFIIK